MKNSKSIHYVDVCLLRTDEFFADQQVDFAQNCDINFFDRNHDPGLSIV